MDSYQSFAEVYDLFMDNVPYDEWAAIYTKILADHGVTGGLLLDLACGTGQMTRRFAARGYDMIGVDLSADMLDVARQYGQDLPEPQILYLLQDMRSFELYGTVAAVVSVCDSLNYILEEDELRQVFSLVNNYLDPGGIFIFDMNTPYKYRDLLGDRSFCESRREAAFLWENAYDPEEAVNEYDLTLFIREQDGRYRRFEERHMQRAWQPARVCQLLKEAGLDLIGLYGSEDPGAGEFEPDKESRALHPLKMEDARMYFVAREHGKQEGEKRK